MTKNVKKKIVKKKKTKYFKAKRCPKKKTDGGRPSRLVGQKKFFFLGDFKSGMTLRKWGKSAVPGVFFLLNPTKKVGFICPIILVGFIFGRPSFPGSKKKSYIRFIGLICSLETNFLKLI